MVLHSSRLFSALFPFSKAQLLLGSTRSRSFPKTNATKIYMLTWQRQKNTLLTLLTPSVSLCSLNTCCVPGEAIQASLPRGPSPHLPLSLWDRQGEAHFTEEETEV